MELVKVTLWNKHNVHSLAGNDTYDAMRAAEHITGNAMSSDIFVTELQLSQILEALNNEFNIDDSTNGSLGYHVVKE